MLKALVSCSTVDNGPWISTKNCLDAQANMEFKSDQQEIVEGLHRDSKQIHRRTPKEMENRYRVSSSCSKKIDAKTREEHETR